MCANVSFWKKYNLFEGNLKQGSALIKMFKTSVKDRKYNMQCQHLGQVSVEPLLRFTLPSYLNHSLSNHTTPKVNKPRLVGIINLFFRKLTTLQVVFFLLILDVKLSTIHATPSLPSGVWLQFPFVPSTMGQANRLTTEVYTRRTLPPPCCYYDCGRCWCCHGGTYTGRKVTMLTVDILMWTQS